MSENGGLKQIEKSQRPMGAAPKDDTPKTKPDPKD